MAEEGPYRKLLGAGWENLAPGVRLSHSVPLCASGELKVFRASRGLAGLLARLMRLPDPGGAVPTRLTLRARGDGVEWIREFGPMRAVSLQRFRDGRVIEEAGPFQIAIVISAEGESIRHRQHGLYLFGVRVPALFGPTVKGNVSPGPDDDGWRLEVEIGHRLAGPVCRYEGVMRAA